MRLKGLIYKSEEELDDVELERRLENIEEKLEKNLEIAHDPHASREARGAASKLHSNGFYYYDALRQIGRGEKDKRQWSRELVTRAALKSLEIGNDNLAGRSTEFGDRRTLQLEEDYLQKSIDSAIGEINGVRAFIQEHENEINTWLTATGLSADDDLRPPGTFAKAGRRHLSRKSTTTANSINTGERIPLMCEALRAVGIDAHYQVVANWLYKKHGVNCWRLGFWPANQIHDLGDKVRHDENICKLFKNSLSTARRQMR